MNQYRVTVKQWIDIKAPSEEEARNTTKSIVDNVWSTYLETSRDGIVVSNSKVMWVQDKMRRRSSAQTLQADVNDQYASVNLSQLQDRLHPAQRKIVELIQTEGIAFMTLREIAKKIGVDYAQQAKYHLLHLKRLA